MFVVRSRLIMSVIRPEISYGRGELKSQPSSDRHHISRACSQTPIFALGADLFVPLQIVYGRAQIWPHEPAGHPGVVETSEFGLSGGSRVIARLYSQRPYLKCVLVPVRAGGPPREQVRYGDGELLSYRNLHLDVQRGDDIIQKVGLESYERFGTASRQLYLAPPPCPAGPQG